MKKEETFGKLLLKAANTFGIIILVFWFLEFFFNERNHPWLKFNLEHPVLMIAGLALALFPVIKFLNWIYRNQTISR